MSVEKIKCQQCNQVYPKRFHEQYFESFYLDGVEINFEKDEICQNCMIDTSIIKHTGSWHIAYWCPKVENGIFVCLPIHMVWYGLHQIVMNTSHKYHLCYLNADYDGKIPTYVLNDKEVFFEISKEILCDSNPIVFAYYIHHLCDSILSNQINPKHNHEDRVSIPIENSVQSCRMAALAIPGLLNSFLPKDITTLISEYEGYSFRLEIKKHTEETLQKAEKAKMIADTKDDLAHHAIKSHEDNISKMLIGKCSNETLAYFLDKSEKVGDKRHLRSPELPCIPTKRIR